MTRQSHMRRLFFILGGILVFIGFLTLPFGILSIVFGFYCVFYGMRFRPIPVQQMERPSSVGQSMPKTQKTSGGSAVLVYQKRLDQLAQLEDQADRQLASLSQYLDQLFTESIPTKTRYLNIISKAEAITDVNLVKARQAVAMFGDGKVTRERIEILDGYVTSSQKMVSEIDNVVTELMQAEQYQLLHDSQILDAAMDELKETVKYYTPAS